MTDLPILALIARWIHIVSASLAIGVPIFMRFVLLPVAARTLAPDSAAQFRQALSARWFKWVNVLILLFLLSGLYTFIAVVLPLDLGRSKAAYHMIFGFKIILALAIFFLASALAGSSRTFQTLRDKSHLFMAILIVMLVIIAILSGVLRSIRDRALAFNQKSPVELVVPPPNR